MQFAPARKLRSQRRARTTQCSRQAAANNRPAACAPRNSHRDRRFDRGMRVVTHQLEVFELEVANVFDRGIQFQPRQRSTITSELFARLLEMVLVKMQVAKGVNEIA